MDVAEPVEAPLDVTVALGTVQTVVDGVDAPATRDEIAAIDADFVRAVNAAGIVRAAWPRDQRSDLRLDVVREAHQVREGFDTAYDVLAGPLPFIALGFPY